MKMEKEEVAEMLKSVSDAMKICAGTELKDLDKVEEERCREILVEINLNRGTTICVRNNAFDSIRSGTYVGGDIVVNGSIVEILDGARYASENYSYFMIPISHIEYVQYKILGNVKYDKENQQLCYEDKRCDMPAVTWEKVRFLREVKQRPYENLD